MSGWLVAAFSAALLMQQAAPAASTPAAQDETTVDSVVVTARSTPQKEALQAFVATVSSPTGNKRLGRWDRKICPGVVGLKQDYAQALIDRIGKAAIEVGLEVGEPGCKANMIVIATDDSDTFVREIVESNEDAFAKYDGTLQTGRKALDAFVVSKAPVRWWHVTRRVTADGQRYDVGDQVRVREVGRLKTGTRDDFDHVIIVMDVKRMGPLRFSALADYIAMAGLAQVDPDAKTEGVSTILNLFADRDGGQVPAEGMTAWDRAYLKGLYGARRDVRRGAAQERDVVRAMGEELGGAPKDPKAAPKDE